MGSQRVTLGPLFPRLIAVLIGAVIVMVAWVVPFTVPADRNQRIEAFCFGLVVLTVLFVPKYGTVTVDADERLITFRESFAAAFLHPWRRREQRELSLAEGCTVLIGWWLDQNAFVTGGVKRIAADGNSVVLFNKIAFDAPIAARLASALRRVEGLSVRTVKLSETFQIVDWTPQEASPGPNTSLLFFLSWVGFPLAILRASTTAISVAGVGCFAVYLIVAYTALRKARTTHAEVDRFSTMALFGFGLFQFVLMYTVMAFLGRAMR